jgi:predicted methyltransferase
MSALPPFNRRAPPGIAPIYLSRYQATPLLRAKTTGEAQVRTSIDLNLTMVLANLADQGVLLPDGRLIGWDVLREVEGSDSGCFVVDGDEVEKIQVYSEVTDRVLTLYPTPGPPTMLVSGVPMHRIKGTSPLQDTISKIGRFTHWRFVLDTATGLGYTAAGIRSAHRVLTVELDPAATRSRGSTRGRRSCSIPRRSRWCWAIASMSSCARRRDVRLHHPRSPMFSLAGELCSGDFTGLRRVLRPGGKLFHCIGDPDSKMSGSVTKGVVRRRRGWLRTRHSCGRLRSNGR